MIVFHPEAEAEFFEAVKYYEDCTAGLGEDFYSEVYNTVMNIQSYVHYWPILEDDIHRCLVNRFPFGVLYSIEKDLIFILAVMNLHRHPDYWKKRR